MTTIQDLPIIRPIAEYEIHLFTHIQTLPVLQGDNGFLYTALASLCQVFGLIEDEEVIRIQQHTVLKSKLVKAYINNKSDQLCLRIGFIGTWLVNLPIDAVEDEGDKEDLITFQQNAAQVLEEAFCAGRLTEWPLIAGLLEEDEPTVIAYKDAVAIMSLARDQLVLDAKNRKILCE